MAPRGGRGTDEKRFYKNKCHHPGTARHRTTGKAAVRMHLVALRATCRLVAGR